MTLATISLFGLPLVDASQQDAVRALLDGARKSTAAFVNAHAANVAHTDAAFRWALERADMLLPDGSGIALAAALRGRRFTANLNGTDLFPVLCAEAAARGLSIYFLGSRRGVAAEAAAHAASTYPGLTIAGARDGYFDTAQNDGVIEAINASGADIVLVALGVPLQDVWIARHRHKLDASLVMGVGAQFDFWSGRVRRAPTWMRRTGTEWLHRLALEPRRLARRYLLGNATFMLRAVKDRLTTDGWAPSQKRLLDIVIAGGALVALSPLWAIVAMAIKLDSRGPILFRQTRIGEHGRPFTVFKFRSMYIDAEDRRAALLAQSDRAGVCFKLKHDPRITRIGRILRRLSIDELPQILNVLRGEMAIVGPRPGLAEEVAAYPAPARARLSVKPGLTGLWQVSGRADVDFSRMIAMDRAYAASRSIILDVALILLTFRAVLTGRGAV